MKENNQTEKEKKKCPICEEGTLTEMVEMNHFEYRGKQLETPLYYSLCNYCGCEQADAEQSRKNKEIGIESKRQVDLEIEHS